MGIYKDLSIARDQLSYFSKGKVEYFLQTNDVKNGNNGYKPLKKKEFLELMFRCVESHDRWDIIALRHYTGARGYALAIPEYLKNNLIP